MGQQQSKDELVYQQVNYGNVEGIKALCREGAGLEWIDKEGKTPLIVACMNSEHLNVAKTLIELGANVNAYRPGCHAGTPLHHAAKRGLDQTVKLLLSHGANSLVMNDDCQTPLEVARVKGYSNVVRAIESHICLFSGWLRELHGPGFLEALAPQWVSRKIWVVVVPCGSRNPRKPLKLELAIYPSSQDAQPRTIIALWKAKMEEPKFHQPDPTLLLYDNSKTRYKLASANEGDKQQLRWLYNACIGIPQVDHAPVVPVSAPPTAVEERPPILHDARLNSEASNSNGWENSVDNASNNGWGSAGGSAPPSKASSSGCVAEPAKDPYNGWGADAGPEGNPTQIIQSLPNIPAVVQAPHKISAPASLIPSAPPIPEVVDDSPIHYPSIDCSPIEFPPSTVENESARTSEFKEDGDASSSCVICLDAPVEGACIPCGHMAGCMSCLNEIKAKKGLCPVCRAKINQVVRLYTV
ncbi:hypothetical protein HHK36_026902 [Tetracentron sinense]|uniref:RING-type domain-containing protein n=1 Tax=Tetracentron sinense TaxID=13715 RepID=A0A834YM78_TETSI|nr:hypothetical protein HHK36_026902 [Tetracentron sinense]